MKALAILIEHAKELYPHFESARGQYDIKRAEALLTETRAAIANAQHALTGDSNDAEHDALVRLLRALGVALNKCDDCDDYVDEIIGCPDGAEVCQDCFDSGAH